MQRAPCFLLSAAAALLLTHAAGCSDDIVDNDQFRSDVLYCENAVARAVDCCPAITVPKTACVHHYSKTTSDCGCSSSDGHSISERRTDPVLTIASSREILDATCDLLTADEGCARIERELARENSWSHSTGCGSSSGYVGGGY